MTALSIRRAILFKNSAKILPTHDRIGLYVTAHKVRRLVDRSRRLPTLPGDKFLAIDGDTPIAEERRSTGAEVIDGV
ncbi:MAG TPA: hypothetical protein VII91_07570 [Bauldia sp.]